MEEGTGRCSHHPRRPDGGWAHEIIELSALVDTLPRTVTQVKPQMARSLVEAGWIDRAGRTQWRTGWNYHVTEAGLRVD